jgi:hypothetical protein
MVSVETELGNSCLKDLVDLNFFFQFSISVSVLFNSVFRNFVPSTAGIERVIGSINLKSEIETN